MSQYWKKGSDWIVLNSVQCRKICKYKHHMYRIQSSLSSALAVAKIVNYLCGFVLFLLVELKTLERARDVQNLFMQAFGAINIFSKYHNSNQSVWSIVNEAWRKILHSVSIAWTEMLSWQIIRLISVPQLEKKVISVSITIGESAVWGPCYCPHIFCVNF